ncbi:MAG: hypothetical protein DI635_12990 [Pseudoxanthomonas suwonensis]|nr:MAG: hypothetical protein DI635_12990 [Pseudoxanthomonas suwonensis]
MGDGSGELRGLIGRDAVLRGESGQRSLQLGVGISHGMFLSILSGDMDAGCIHAGCSIAGTGQASFWR